MELSNLGRSLRITFLSIGFLMFVVMAVHWVQHVSTAKPVLAPRFIAATPSTLNQSGHIDLRGSSLASFVARDNQAETAAKNSSAPKTSELSAAASKTATPSASSSTAADAVHHATPSGSPVPAGSPTPAVPAAAAAKSLPAPVPHAPSPTPPHDF